MTSHGRRSGGMTRGTLLRKAGALGTVGLTAPLVASAATAARAATTRPRDAPPLRHLVIDCQENRSFDHYFGFAPFIGRYGVPSGYTQPDGSGGSVAPF